MAVLQQSYLVVSTIAVFVLLNFCSFARAQSADTIPCPRGGPDPCAPNGRCVAAGFCVCQASASQGFWAGLLCDECAPGYAGDACTTACAGGACFPCNLHGTCNDGRSGDGRCSCFQDQLRGFWAGGSCAQCSPSYYGFHCNTTCPGVNREEGVVCHGHGACDDDVTGRGSCTCEPGFGAESFCADCDASHFGSDCGRSCGGLVEEGPDRGQPCSGHGVCDSGISGTGRCSCAPQWGSADCSSVCPNNCSFPFGTCLGGSEREARCQCDAFHTSDDCSVCAAGRTGPGCGHPCPRFDGRICSNNGNCTFDDTTQEAICICVGGYHGALCERACPGTPPCSGNGVCVPAPAAGGDGVGDVEYRCECYADYTRGFWTGALCDRCREDFGVSTTCRRVCPKGGPNDAVCSGHGTCIEGECFCSRFTPAGFDHCGAACENASVPGIVDLVTGRCLGCTCVYCPLPLEWGAACIGRCAGYNVPRDSAPRACSTNGYCREGRNGDGTCECRSGWTGELCSLPCPVSPENSEVCGGPARGRCVAMPIASIPNVTGGHTAGRSSIEPEYGAVCECLPAFGGWTCDMVCPMAQGLVCSGHGVCSNHLGGDVTCVCDRRWAGRVCNAPCSCDPMNGRCDARACLDANPLQGCDVCACDGNFTGRCDVCRNGTQGPRCGSPCVHGITVGRSCECFTNFSTPSCDVPCPSSPLSSEPCSGRGVCIWGSTQSGSCACFSVGGMPLFFGPACEVNCSRQLCREREGLLNPQCNPASGQCECQDSLEGRWQGRLCDVCRNGYWGALCDTRCECNNRGTCNMDSGVCECFDSDKLGHFTGDQCTQCRAGFVGLDCRERNSVSTRVDRPVTTTHALAPPADAPLWPQNAGSPFALAVDELRHDVYAGGSPVFKLGVTQEAMTQKSSSADAVVRAAESFSCSVEQGEVFHAWVAGPSVYFVMQPSALCRRGVRVIQADRDDSETAFVTTTQFGDQDWIDNSTLRIVACATRETDSSTMLAQPVVLSVVLAQFSGPGGTGVQYPGGFVITVDITALVDGSNFDFISRLALPSDFIPHDVAHSRDNTIAVAGERISANGGGGDGATERWDVLLLRRSVDQYVPAVGGVNATLASTNAGSLRAAPETVPCWAAQTIAADLVTGAPRVTLLPQDACMECVRATKVLFFRETDIVTVIERTPPLSPIVAWLRPMSESTAGQHVVGPFIVTSDDDTDDEADSEPATECRLASVYFDTALDRLRIVAMVGEAADGETADLLPNSFFAAFASLDVPDTEPTAAIIDRATNTTLVAVRPTQLGGTAASSLLKVRLQLDRFTLFGVVPLQFASIDTIADGAAAPQGREVVNRLAIDHGRRLLYTVFNGTRHLHLTTFILAEVYSLTPLLADERGGTVFTLRGAGFKAIDDVSDTASSQPYPVMCRFGGEGSGTLVQSLSFSETEVRCEAPPVAASDAVESCVGQVVEVSLFGSQTRWATTNEVRLRRIQAPAIREAVPSRGSVVGGTRVVLRGEGFVESTTLLCRFWAVGATQTLFVSASFLNTTAVACTQPAAQNASVPPGLLDVAMDGQVYSEPAPYSIIGNATDLEIVQSITVVASQQTNFSVEVFVIDEQLQRLTSIDRSSARPVQLQVKGEATPCAPEAYRWFGNQTLVGNFPQDPCREMMVEMRSNASIRNTTDGAVVFDDLFLARPRSTTLRLAFVELNTGWVAETELTVLAGNAHALFIANYEWYLGRGGSGVPHRFENERALVPEPELIVVDELANEVRTIAELVIEARALQISDADNSVTVSSMSYVQGQRAVGVAIVFSEIVLPFVHGASHHVNFTSISHPQLVPAITPPLRTAVCEGRSEEYKVPGTSTCLPCPGEGAVCDGSETIVVLPTYWRASENLTFVYRCEQNPFNCFGEPRNASDYATICEDGYEGPLCTVCSDGYGRSVGRTCAACPSPGAQIRDVTLIGLAAIIGLLVWTIVVMRDVELTDITIILRTVVNHMQATGSIGEFSNQWDPFLKSIFEVQGSGSSVSFSGLSSLDCLVRSHGYGYDAIFALYMLLPLLSIVLAIFVYLAVRVLKLKPAITDSLRQRLIDEARESPNTANAVILHRYPFLFVLVPTVSIFMFSVYQTLITESTSVLRCTPLILDDSGVEQFFMQVDMSMRCTDSGDHSFRGIAMMCAFIYGIGFPLLFAVSFRFITARSGKRELANVMFLFMVGGYKERYWFWQAVIMIRKMALVGIIVFVEDNKELQSYAAVWTMSVALVLQLWFSPNEKAEHNQVEALSLALLAITMNLGLLYIWPDLPQLGINILTALLIVITLGAAAMFAYFILRPVLRDARVQVKALRDKFNTWRTGGAKQKKDIQQRLRIHAYNSSDDEEESLGGHEREIGVNVAGAHDLSSLRTGSTSMASASSPGTAARSATPSIRFINPAQKRGRSALVAQDDDASATANLNFQEFEVHGFDDTGAATPLSHGARHAPQLHAIDVAPTPLRATSRLLPRESDTELQVPQRKRFNGIDF